MTSTTKYRRLLRVSRISVAVMATFSVVSFGQSSDAAVAAAEAEQWRLLQRQLEQRLLQYQQPTEQQRAQLIQQLLQMQQAAASGAPQTAAQLAEQQRRQIMMLQQFLQTPKAPTTGALPFAAQIANQQQAAQQQVQSAVSGASPSTVAAALPPKKPGVVRIGIVLPKVQLGAQVPSDSLTEPIRQTLSTFLQGPTLEVVPVTARVPAQVLAEAQQSQMDYMLSSSVTRKEHKKAGMLAGVASRVAPAIAYMPGGGLVASQVKGAAASAAMSVAPYLSSFIKDKDELVVEYRLLSGDGKTVQQEKTLSVKAEQAGQDLLSPLAEQVATAVLQAVTQK